MSTETCCFCIERKVGCIVLAVLSLINSIYSIVKEFLHENGKHWGNILLYVIFAAAAIILLIGILKEQYGLFMPYFILQGLGIILLLSFIVILSIVVPLFNGLQISWMFILFIVYIFITFGLEVYFLYVVYKYRNDVSDRLPR